MIASETRKFRIPWGEFKDRVALGESWLSPNQLLESALDALETSHPSRPNCWVGIAWTWAEDTIPWTFDALGRNDADLDLHFESSGEDNLLTIPVDRLKGLDKKIRYVVLTFDVSA